MLVHSPGHTLAERTTPILKEPLSLVGEKNKQRDGGSAGAMGGVRTRRHGPDRLPGGEGESRGTCRNNLGTGGGWCLPYRRRQCVHGQGA